MHEHRTAAAGHPPRRWRRWRGPAAGAAVGTLPVVLALIAVADARAHPDPGCLALCGPGVVFVFVAVTASVVLLVFAAALALPRATRRFALGMVLGDILTALLPVLIMAEFA